MLNRDLARFLIAAKTFLYNEKLKNPDINIYDHEVPREEVVCIAKMSESEAEEAAKNLQNAGMIHMFVCDDKFGSCKVASLAFDKLDEFLTNYRGKP